MRLELHVINIFCSKIKRSIKLYQNAFPLQIIRGNDDFNRGKKFKSFYFYSIYDWIFHVHCLLQLINMQYYMSCLLRIQTLLCISKFLNTNILIDNECFDIIIIVVVCLLWHPSAAYNLS